MKKPLIAGASVAALGLAVVPFAGVFAATESVKTTDIVKLTVAESCTFSAGGTGTEPTATSVAAGSEANFGILATHKFTIKCNSNKYEVTAVATDLELQNKPTGATHTTIGYTDNASYDTAAAATNKADDGVWTAVLTGGDKDKAIGKSTAAVIKSGTATTTDAFSVNYKALAGAAQTQGTYQGTVTYTLTGKDS